MLLISLITPDSICPSALVRAKLWGESFQEEKERERERKRRGGGRTGVGGCQFGERNKEITESGVCLSTSGNVLLQRDKLMGQEK